MQKPNGNNVEAPSLLMANKVRTSLKYLNGWHLTDDHKTIYRDFNLHNFIAAVDLIDRIALIAEEEKHHPDIHLTQYRNLRVGLTTHEVGGLSEKDFTVAQKINSLPIPNKTVAVNPPLKNKEQARKGSSKIKNKPKQRISVVPKKNDNKTKETKIKKSSNRLDQLKTV